MRRWPRQPPLRAAVSLALVLLASRHGAAASGSAAAEVASFLAASAPHGGGNHTSTWAVLLSTSRGWFNYRHAANALAVYRTVRRLGVPDAQIVLMLADDVACNPRNPFPGEVYGRAGGEDLYGGGDTEVDYRGPEVTADAFLRVLTGLHPAHEPPGRRLLSDGGSNVLVYATGHGGASFLKFQDSAGGGGELTAAQLGAALAQAAAAGRYRELLFVADTCQAATLWPSAPPPGAALALASSAAGEKSWSGPPHPGLGLHPVDRFTAALCAFLDERLRTPRRRDEGGGGGGGGGDGPASVADLLAHPSLSFAALGSTAAAAGARAWGRPLGATRLRDFFAQPTGDAAAAPHPAAAVVTPWPRP